MATIICNICRSKSNRNIYSLYDDRYGYPGRFNLFFCENCGHRFLFSNLDEEKLCALYSSFYPRSSFSLEDFSPAKSQRGFMAWMNGERRSAYVWIPAHVRILDIGCGFGEALAYHQQRGCEVYGVEADENICRVAERYGFKVHVGLFTPDIYEPSSFDYVTMDQVIEHVTDPLATLRGIAKVLKPGGVAILSTPNADGWGAKFFGRRWINWHAPYHQQFFSLKSMRIAAGQAGLELRTVRTITSSKWLHYQWAHLATCPKVGKCSSYWSSKMNQSFYEKMMLRMISCLHKTKLNHGLTRFFDFFGVGDNFLFILEKT